MATVQARTCCRTSTTSPHTGRLQVGLRAFVPTTAGKRLHPKQAKQLLRASAESEAEPKLGSIIENPDSDIARKQAIADELRRQEKFMTVGTGEALCKGCGYVYEPKKGDPDYPIAKGVQFQNLPEDWQCPVCGADKTLFENRQKEVAGFAANQGYGLGTNSMTSGQKSLLIYGSLLLFFALFLLGYTLE